MCAYTPTAEQVASRTSARPVANAAVRTPDQRWAARTPATYRTAAPPTTTSAGRSTVQDVSADDTVKGPGPSYPLVASLLARPPRHRRSGRENGDDRTPGR